MLHRSRRFGALLLALSLAAIAPAATQAVAETPTGVNLLSNGSFNTKPNETSGPVPRWNVSGGMIVEKFGTQSFPSKAYGNNYDGGARYLRCVGDGGTITQTIDVTLIDPTDWKAKLSVSYGGTKGHRIVVTTEALDSSGNWLKEKETAKALEVTNHYKLAVAAVNLPAGTAKVRVSIQLKPKSGQNSCKIMADTAKLVLEAR